MRARLSVLAAAFLAACGGGSEPAVEPPANLTYATNPAVYTAGVAIPANTPSSSGGAVTSYSVSPALPAGLGLHPSTGVVSGTPAAATAPATYTVTASNSSGSTTVSLTITIHAAIAPPAGLAYSVNPAVYTTGVTITANTPSSSGGAVSSYSVSPALPTGLSLDRTTGVVSGTPTTVTAIATYTVTASNSAGSTSVGLVITITAAVIPPGGLAYSVNPAVYTVGVGITPNTASSTGGAVTSYSVSPALPAGLVLDTSTGVVSGTPGTATATATYTVTASNPAGSTSVGLVITVNGSAWHFGAALPISRADHAAVSVGPFLYVLGGHSGSTLALVDRGFFHMNSWTRMAPMQTARREFAAGVIEGKIYVACGMNWTSADAVTYVTTTEVYDPAANVWSTLAPCPMDPPANGVYGNVHIGGTAAGGRLYVVQFNTNSPGSHTTLHAYDPGTNTWTPRAPPPFGDATYSAAEVGGSLYLVASYPSRPSASPQTVESRLARYDAATDAWIVLPSLAGIAAPTVSGYNGKLYALGGFKLVSGTMTVVTDANLYDPATGEWSSIAPVGVARYRAAAAVVDDLYDRELSFVGGSTSFDWTTVTPTTATEGMLVR